MNWTANLTMLSACSFEPTYPETLPLPPPLPLSLESNSESKAEMGDHDFYPGLLAREMGELELHGDQKCNYVTLLASLENFQRDLQECREPKQVLALTQLYLQGLGIFSTTALMVTEAPDWSFRLATCVPESAEATLAGRIAAEIRSGTFAWAVRQNRSVVVRDHGSESDAPLILQSLGTRSGLFGMFVGQPKNPSAKVKNLPLSLLSIILTNCACALENRRLAAAIIQHNETLQQRVSERTEQLSTANAALHREIEERQRTAEALATQTEQLMVTLRAIGDGVITTDNRGQIVLLNPAAERLTGWSAAEALGRTLSYFFTPRDAETGRSRLDWLDRVLHLDEISVLPPNLSLTDRHGNERWIAGSVAPIRDHARVRLGTVLVLRDVTGQERVARELLKASKVESLIVLAGGIAHDFNNILTAIIGNVTLAATYPEDLQQTAIWLGEANKASNRARDLTQQLLTFAKGGAPVCKTVQLQEILREATRFALHGANVNAGHALAKDLWTVEVDTGQLSQVIHNIVLNAVQAMPSGGTIQVGAENVRLSSESALPLPNGNYIKVSVQDHGGGIPAANLARVFDPFFTTKKTGTGLGLATCYTIIKRHRGHITVDSQVGVGTTFHLYLPASEKLASVPVIQSFAKPVKGQGRLLVMEDDPQLSDCIHSMLRQLGYEVCVRSNSVEAVRCYRDSAAQKRPFDAVILDLTIRGGAGARETVGELRAFDPQLKAIVSSGHTHDPAIAEFRACGFGGVITKPYSVEQMASVLQTTLSGTPGHRIEPIIART